MTDETSVSVTSNIQKMWPLLSEVDKARLMGFVEGLAFKATGKPAA